MVLTIPGGKVLFSILQDALYQKCDEGLKVRLSVKVHEILHDFRWLASNLTRRPTRIAELVPSKTPGTLTPPKMLLVKVREGSISYPYLMQEL
jgi:hypothetical protein